MTDVTGIDLPALAYLGPGGLLGSLGAFIALIGALLLALLGLIWYPMKRLFAGRRKQRDEGAGPVEDRRP
ncbi:MAG: hypothetical protein KDC98_22085 [Planctomycetes bacterium]|nr:hypothetical protein [Planctomycetota bacterium]